MSSTCKVIEPTEGAASAPQKHRGQPELPVGGWGAVLWDLTQSPGAVSSEPRGTVGPPGGVREALGSVGEKPRWAWRQSQTRIKAQAGSGKAEGETVLKNLGLRPSGCCLASEGVGRSRGRGSGGPRDRGQLRPHPGKRAPCSWNSTVLTHYLPGRGLFWSPKPSGGFGHGGGSSERPPCR